MKMCTYKLVWEVKTQVTTYGDTYAECKRKVLSDLNGVSYAVRDYTKFEVKAKLVKVIKKNEYNDTKRTILRRVRDKVRKEV